jgi:hypothetical protein
LTRDDKEFADSDVGDFLTSKFLAINRHAKFHSPPPACRGEESPF